MIEIKTIVHFEPEALDAELEEMLNAGWSVMTSNSSIQCEADDVETCFVYTLQRTVNVKKGVTNGIEHRN